jgi:hypothetical protein
MLIDQFSAYFEQYTWTQDFELDGENLLSLIDTLVTEGNVRRLIVCQPDGAVLLEVPVMPYTELSSTSIAALQTVSTLSPRLKLEVVHSEEIPQWGTD